MTDIQEKPLISFVIVAYNHERFVREAVEGAFSQTYSPLEIVLSDDCSPDRTFEIMQAMAAEYRGPHKIILNRNKKNLGIGAHFNRIMELSHGELIVGSASDDISLPERTSEIYRAWLDTDKKAFSLDSMYEVIDESGNITGRSSPSDPPQELSLLRFSKTLTNLVSGFSHAWHRKVFDVFGPLPDITSEDIAIPPRSVLLGGVFHIAKPLVKYRMHGANVHGGTKPRTEKEDIDRMVYYFNDRMKICPDVIRCINQYKSTIQDLSRIRELDECVSGINLSKDELAIKVRILTGSPIVRLYNLLKFAFLYGVYSQDFALYASQTLPKPVYRLLRRIYKGFFDVRRFRF
jgi:glycosyltransferase involved in cell wall biosynthesis